VTIAVLEQIPRFGGGSERISLSLSRHVIGRGHRAWLLYSEEGDMVRAYTEAGASTRRLPVLPVAVRKPREAARSIAALARFVRAERVDVLFTSQVNFVSLLAAIAALTGVRTAVHLGLVYDYPSPIFRRSIRAISIGISPSTHTTRGWIERGWPERSLRTIPNGVDAATFTPGDREAARADLGFAPADRLIAFVGRLVPEKGIGTLMRAFAALGSDSPSLHLMFVGSAPEGRTHELARLANEIGLDAARWSVHPATSAPERVYRAADVVVVPSEWDEPFGLVPVEAMMCGALTVVSDRGVLPSFVAPVGERACFPAGGVQALADRLRYWLADDQRRDAAAAALRCHAHRHYAFEACGDAYLSAFQSVLAS
jgi:glycosyltransferase involved in cell wall biosynthesis